MLAPEFQPVEFQRIVHAVERAAVQLSEAVVRRAQIVVAVGVVRIALDGLLEARQGAFVIGLLIEGDPFGVLRVRGPLAAAVRQRAQRHGQPADAIRHLKTGRRHGAMTSRWKVASETPPKARLGNEAEP